MKDAQKTMTSFNLLLQHSILVTPKSAIPLFPQAIPQKFLRPFLVCQITNIFILKILWVYRFCSPSLEFSLPRTKVQRNEMSRYRKLSPAHLYCGNCEIMVLLVCSYIVVAFYQLLLIVDKKLLQFNYKPTVIRAHITLSRWV